MLKLFSKVIIILILKLKFLEILDAYNTLSDVNEKTWYDNHRERIL